MFSYLRSHHKWANSGSNPPSPVPPSLHSQDSPLQSAEDFSYPPVPSVPRIGDSDSQHSNSPISPTPPVLPPIPRVASQREEGRGPHVAGKVALQGRIHPEPGWQPRSPDPRNLAAPSFSPNPSITVAAYRDGGRRPPTAKSTFTNQSAGRPNTQSSTASSFELHPNAAPPSTSSSSSTAFSSHPSSYNPPPPPKSPQVPSSQARSGKNKFNLRNPMSLLMRRRSSQALNSQSSDSLPPNKNLTIPAMRLPDGYDPRIRGKGVHDFNAPRTRRNFSHDAATLTPESSGPSPSFGGRRKSDTTAFDNYNREPDSEPGPEYESPRSGEREYTPIFKEHFGDDIEPWGGAQNDRANVPLDSSYHLLSSASLSENDSDAPALPPFARHLPPNLQSTTPRDEPSTPVKQSLPVVQEIISPEASPKQDGPSPPQVRSRGPSVRDSSFKPQGLPKHLSSNASRFSFDLAGMGSATQEKLLEDKHKQKVASKEISKPEPPNDAADPEGDMYDDEEDMYDYDNMDDDGGFEEKIPGVNADADEVEGLGIAGGIGGFDFSSMRSALANPISPVSPVISTGTPRDEQGNVIGSAVWKESPDLRGPLGPNTDSSPAPFEQLPTTSSQGIPSMDNTVSILHEQQAAPTQSPQPPLNPVPLAKDDDDLYFDDGLIDLSPGGEESKFDESVFDDPNGHLYDRRIRYPADVQASNDSSPAKDSTKAEDTNIVSRGSQVTGSAYSAGSENDHNVSLKQRHKSIEPPGLLRDNLAAYHDALAAATNRAAAEGKFNRRESIDTGSSEDYEADDPSFEEGMQPGLVPDDGRISQETAFSPLGYGDDASDDFDYDGALEDDPMIAAANAEALANDAEGFYGQEFGFYAQATGADEAEYFNGGYFGPRALDGLLRSQSGRVALREPNLTPITERSEYSNRNSLISLSLPGGPQSAHTLPSPGLAQLAMMSPDFEDELSLSTLMKLRRGAWGGSNGSLRSAGSAPSQSSSSPFSYLPPLGPGSLTQASIPTDGSSYSVASSSGFDSDDVSGPGSPTITLANAPPRSDGSKSSASDSDPVRRTIDWKKAHSRTGSGADSVSYMKEEDESGGGRWVLERRRTAETGEVEIVGREVVEGGRI